MQANLIPVGEPVRVFLGVVTNSATGAAVITGTGTWRITSDRAEAVEVAAGNLAYDATTGADGEVVGWTYTVPGSTTAGLAAGEWYYVRLKLLDGSGNPLVSRLLQRRAVRRGRD